MLPTRLAVRIKYSPKITADHPTPWYITANQADRQGSRTRILELLHDVTTARLPVLRRRLSVRPARASHYRPCGFRGWSSQPRPPDRSKPACPIHRCAQTFPDSPLTESSVAL